MLAKTIIAAVTLSAALAPLNARAADPLDARQAGARYGQALGVALVCYGLKTTPAVERLPTNYTGADADLFKAESEKVLLAWRDAKTCKKAGGPNECRLIHEWSCRDAVLEIGPEGTKLPGLVEPKN